MTSRIIRRWPVGLRWLQQRLAHRAYERVIAAAQLRRAAGR